MPASKEQLWTMALPDLVDETLPKSAEAEGVNYAAMARAVLDARIVMDAGKEAAAASKSAARAATATAVGTALLVIATLALALATVALVVVEVARNH